MIRLEKINVHFYEIRFSNDMHIGNVIFDMSGEFYIKLFSRGLWTADSLIQIGELVKQLNKDTWNNHLDTTQENPDIVF